MEYEAVFGGSILCGWLIARFEHLQGEASHVTNCGDPCGSVRFLCLGGLLLGGGWIRCGTLGVGTGIWVGVRTDLGNGVFRELCLEEWLGFGRVAYTMDLLRFCVHSFSGSYPHEHSCFDLPKSGVELRSLQGSPEQPQLGYFTTPACLRLLILLLSSQSPEDSESQGASEHCARPPTPPPPRLRVQA